MRKLLFILIIIILASFSSAQSITHYLIVQDDADEREVALARQVEGRLEENLNLSFDIKLEKQIHFSDRKERITIDIRRNEAFIFIGEESGFGVEDKQKLSDIVSGEMPVSEEPQVEPEDEVAPEPTASPLPPSGGSLDEGAVVQPPAQEVKELGLWQRFVNWIKNLFQG